MIQPKYKEVDLSELSPEAKYRARWMKQTEDRPNQRTPPGDWDNLMVLAGRGFGKKLDINTPIPTPNGWKTMGTVEIGDDVFDESGRICQVTWTSEISTPELAYRLEFQDGSFLDACSEHQWVTWTNRDRRVYTKNLYEEDTERFPSEWPVWRAKKRNAHGRYSVSPHVMSQASFLSSCGWSPNRVATSLGISHATAKRYSSISEELIAVLDTPIIEEDSAGPTVKTTQQIVDTLVFGVESRNNHCIPNCGPLDTPKKLLPISPYVLGVWLGDGSSHDGTITQHEPDQPFMRAEIVKEGFRCGSRKDPQVFQIWGLNKKLRLAGLIANKHVPSAYLRSSVEQRLSLLQGLMDTDGCMSAKSGVAVFCNTNKNLCNAVFELATSLGMRPYRCDRQPSGISKLKYEIISFSPTLPVFRLPRKVARLGLTGRKKIQRHCRYITSAVMIQPVPMRCISVNSKHSMYLAGRSMIPTHNTRMGAEDVSYYGLSNPGCRIAIVAPTFAAARNTNIEGESGLIKCLPPSCVDKWNRSLGELILKNGTIYSIYTAEKPDALRGPQHHRAWCDELAQFANSGGGDPQYIWDMLKMGLRLGSHPQVIITTTPLPLPIIKGLCNDKRTYVVTGSTYENSKNLPESTLNELRTKYEGTRIGEQELYAKILDDVPGALWKREWIDNNRLSTRETPDEVAQRCIRVVVAIDPATTSTKESDFTGIVVAGMDESNHGYILADDTCKVSPRDWAAKAIHLMERFKADRIIGETNNGGDMVMHTIHTIDDSVPFKKVSASRGKYVRAEPIASLYEQGRISHVGRFDLLESEMCMFTPENILKNSPNRADALTWACTDLFHNSITYGALNYLKTEQAKDAEMPITQKIAMALGLTKPVISDNAVECPVCKSKSLCVVAGQNRCNQCGNQFPRAGHRLTHDYINKRSDMLNKAGR